MSLKSVYAETGTTLPNHVPDEASPVLESHAFVDVEALIEGEDFNLTPGEAFLEWSRRKPDHLHFITTRGSMFLRKGVWTYNWDVR